ncbi:putative zinc metallopeptidase protein [Moniliophthora roreri MCA 2997]|uniref:Zinc metallopeptidase protein n=1 Tax=Moniliophthora roreri (strain MCA 2997) TaxID=1381753 RepID=V2YTJ2_MONRO|nr:putative zinc metallopeptidase protein [Moniliophthora roreri MCA 2997]
MDCGLPLTPLCGIRACMDSTSTKPWKLGKLSILNARIASNDANSISDRLWNIECREGKVVNIEPAGPISQPLSNATRQTGYEVDAHGSIVLPSLCHSHIHLDKCFILGRGGDLITGDFTEAMNVTGKAKAGFPLDKDDLMNRGRKLIRDSVDCGVTSMRAHVEVDSIVGLTGLDAALQLKEEFLPACHVQIAVFAQEGLFESAEDNEPGDNYHLLLQAITRNGIDVVGSAPYVEPSREQAQKNIALILEAARHNDLHVDFHLDYNLNPYAAPLIYDVISLVKRDWHLPKQEPRRPKRRITIGHATRLQLFSVEEWQNLVASIGDLPITFVSLPNSDMYMQGREATDTPMGPPRSTLRVPYLAKQYGLEIAMSVNNVENAFTPQGPLDPLALCTFGVAVFQSATNKDIRTLLVSVPYIS